MLVAAGDGYSRAVPVKVRLKSSYLGMLLEVEKTA